MVGFKLLFAGVPGVFGFGVFALKRCYSRRKFRVFALEVSYVLVDFWSDVAALVFSALVVFVLDVFTVVFLQLTGGRISLLRGFAASPRFSSGVCCALVF